MIIIFIFVLLLLISKMLIRDRFSLIFLQLYIIWWGLLLFISTFDPYDLYPVSLSVYGLLILSVFCFSFGFITNRYVGNVNIHNGITLSDNTLLENYNEFSKSKIFLGTLVLFSLFISKYLFQYQRLVLLYGADDARNMRYNVGSVFNSGVEILFYNFFVEGFSNLVCIYLAFSLVWLKFNKAFYFSVLFIYLYSSFGAGRGTLIELGFYICFLFLIKSKIIDNRKKISSAERKKMKSQKRTVLIVILPILIFMYLFSIYLSNFRNGLFELTIENFIIGNDEFFSQIIIYCVGSFRALEYGINNFSDSIGYTYGSLSFGGLDEIMGILINKLGIGYEYSNAIYGVKTADRFPIGIDKSFNALFTSVFGQYLDFGVLGVIFLSFFWGFIFNKAIVYFQRKRTISALFIVSFLFITAIMTPLTWKLQTPSAWIFLGFMFVNRKK